MKGREFVVGPYAIFFSFRLLIFRNDKQRAIAFTTARVDITTFRNGPRKRLAYRYDNLRRYRGIRGMFAASLPWYGGGGGAV